MEENSKVYRIRTKVGEDSPNVIHVPINQTYDTFEILSLKLNQTDTYKTYESGYGIIVGRIIANGGFGVPNSKVSVFIEVDDNESLKDTLLYNFTSTSDTDNNGVRYNLLPDYVESECHQDVGTFPNKRLVLDNDDVIEIFDKYWKYTTTTNNSGDYMLFGIPTGSQQLHVDIDLSDCGVLSQRPHNMIGKGYDIGMFESPNKFKSSTNLNSLPQIVTEDRGVYVYPYWGDTSNGDNTFAITRCDINIEYKFESTAVFMGSIITDKGSNAIGKNCTATINNGKMSELVTGEGTIEMIRKTIDGRVEQFPIMGNRLIDGDGTWVYEIPMNLDYVTTDEFGNFVPTDNPDKGIATRARVRFRVRLDDTQYDNTARKRACYLIPNNPRLEDEGFDKTMEVDYEFGSLTREESYRDLFWNKVYTVKSYIPKIQKGDEQYNRQHTGIKWVNHANQNNPMPYNTLTVKLSFVHRIICILTGLVVQFVAFINQLISTVSFLFAVFIHLPSALIKGMAEGFEEIWLVGNLIAAVFRGVGSLVSTAEILGGIVVKHLTPKCIVLDRGFCDDNVNKKDYYPGCGWFLFYAFEFSDVAGTVSDADIAWRLTKAAHNEEYSNASPDEAREPENDPVMLHNCYENALAQENEATSFNFNNDWINGTLYAPLWYRKITPKKRFFFGLFSRKAKDEWCSSKQYFPSLRYIQHCAIERDGSKSITNFDGDTTDLKFVRNSECEDGDCHERHVALPGLGGVIHSKKTMLGQDVYYYKPVEWSANLPSNELYTGKKKGELKLLFATDIVLLGSLDSCDMNGIPQFFKNLESTTYNMPGDILFTDYEFHYVIDPETGEATSNINTLDSTVHSEMAGCDWGNPNEFNKKDGGLFYGIGCTNGDTELYAKSCVNLSRICEYGVSLDVTKQIPILEKWNEKTSESEIEQAEDGAYYKRLITDGFISWDELYNLDERSMFATMNGNQLKTKINTKNGLKEYDFRYLYPENFDGSLAERMKRRTQNYPPEVNYKFNYLLEKASRDYYLFRMGNKPYYYDSNNAFPRYENSFYFYFGLNEGKTAIEKFNSKYFAECDNEKGVYNNFNIYKKSSSWCSSLNNTYDGFIALDLEKIATPYSIVITGDNTYTLDNISDEKIIFYNDKPEGFEDYTKRELNNGVENIPIIPNGAYYLTITDANEEEYHYEVDMSYNFLMYSNNVQSFKKNHEDLLRSLGTNNAIMNDNTKLVYSNPEKIEREIGGVITVYGVHDNDGDIEQYKIEVREKVDFDKTDIQKTIENVGDTWYDKDGNFCEVISIEGNTIHYTKNGGTEHYTDKKKGDIVEEYKDMTKKLVVPEWYDKDAVKHYLTEKDEEGNYVYEEGTQQADFKPLVKELRIVGYTWYDAEGYFCEVTSITPQGEKIISADEWSALAPTQQEWYEEVYVKENGEETIILSKDEWEVLAPDVRANYTKMYRNKIIIHYTKNGEEEDEEGNPYIIVDYTISGRNTVVDYTDWTLELNLPTYYNKNGEKQYYHYQPDKETSVVDFELSDRLKEITSFVPQDNEILTVEHWNGLSTEEKSLFDEVYINKQDSSKVIDAEAYDELPDYNQDCYEEVYVNRNDETDIRSKAQWEELDPDIQNDYVQKYRNKYEEDDIIDPDEWADLTTGYCKRDYDEAYVNKTDLDIIISKEQWESIEDPVEKDKYAKMYRNKYDIIHYTKNGEGDYRGRATWYDADGVEHTASSGDIGKTVVDYTDWVLELTPPTWYDLDGNFCEVTSIVPPGEEVITAEKWSTLTSTEKEWYDEYEYVNKVTIIHYTKKNAEEDFIIGGRNTVTEVTFNSSLENAPYLEHLYNLYKGDDYVEKYYLEGSDDGVEYGISYKVISPYALTTDEYDKLTEYGKFDYEQKYVNKTDSSIIISKEQWEKLESDEEREKYEPYKYIHKTDKSNIIIPEDYNQLPDYNQGCYEEVYVKNDGTEILTKGQWEALGPEERGNYEQKYRNKYKEDDIIDPDEWAELPTEYCKRDYAEAYIHKTDESNIITPEAYNGLSDGYGRNRYKEEISYCKIENKTEFITKEEYDDNVDIQFLYQQFHVLNENEDNILIEKGYEESLKEKDYNNIIVNYNAFKKRLNPTDNTVISFYTKKGVTKDCNYDSTHERWEYNHIPIKGNYIIDYQNLKEVKASGEVYYDYEGNRQPVNQTQTVIDFTSLVRVLSFETWLDEDGALCEVKSIEGGTIYYTKNGEEEDEEHNPYTIIGRNTVINYNQPIWTKTTRSDDNYSWVDKNGVTQYAGAEKLVVDYSWLLETTTQEEIVWYDKEGNVYKVTSVDTDGKIHYTINGKGDNTDKKVGDIVVDFNHDKIVLTLDEIGDAWYDEEGNFCEVTSVVDGTIHYTINGEGDKTDKKVGDTVVNYYRFMTEPLYLPTWYDADGNLYKVTSIGNDGSTIHYTRNGEGDYADKKIGDTVVDWSKYIGYEGAEITYDNGVITDITNVLWYDSEKQSFAFGVPDENRTYIITVTQLCNVGDTVFETKNRIETNVFVSGVIKYKMFINGIDYEIIKNFDGHTGWSYNGTITKNKLATNVGDLNENNPWFNVDKIYYHNNFGGNNDYPEIKLKDIERFGIDKNESEQTYAIYATEIDKEDEEVGKKVNETYHGEDGKNKTVEANDVIATFVDKRNEDDVTTYKVINFTVKNLMFVGETWYDDDDNLCKTTNVVIQGKEILTNEQRNTLSTDEEKTLYIEVYVNKQDSSVIPIEAYNRLEDDYGQKSYDVYQYVNETDSGIITKVEWEDLSEEQRANYKPYTYVNKYDATKIISSDVWDDLPLNYCKGDYAKMYRNKYAIVHYTKNSEGDYRGRVTWDDKEGKVYIVTTIMPPNEEVITVDKWNSLTPDEQEWYEVYHYVNKQDSTVIITPEAYNRLDSGYSQKSYNEVYVKENGEETIILTKEQWEALAPEEWDDYTKMYCNKYDATKFITPDVWGKLPIKYCQDDYIKMYRNKYVITHYTRNGEGDYRSRVSWYDADGYFCEVTSIDTDGTIHYTKNGEGNYTIVGRNTVVDYSDWVITLNIIISLDTYNQLPDYTQNSYDEVYVKNDGTEILTKEQWERIEDTAEKNKYAKMYRNKYVKTDIKNYFKQYKNKQVPSEFISTEAYNRLDGGYGQKSYDVYNYINKQDSSIITKAEWEDLSKEQRDNYKPHTYVNKYDAIKIISSDVWDKLPKDYCKGDYTEVYLSTWYDKNGTLNYMLPSEEGQERIDFRPLVKTIEKEGETWYDVNSVKRVAGSDDIGQEVLDYSKQTEITQLKEITFEKNDKTWYDKNGIVNEVDSDKLGLYIDITYMTKGDDTTLFNIHNKEYIDKLVIDKVEVYCQDSYDEVYVNKTNKTDIRSKDDWEALAPDERDNYVKMYLNKYDASDIITPTQWGKLPIVYRKGGNAEIYTYQYNFGNKYGLHNVRIYLVQQETATAYQNLLSNVINFDGCSDLNTIVLPNIGITTIGDSAFKDCKSLTSIDLPDSITTIDDDAFNGCEKLSSVYIPYNVKRIGNSAFNGCKSLTNIVLPKKITTIGNSAFANCEKLQSVRAEMTIVNNNDNVVNNNSEAVNIASNAFDNTNIGLIIYVPMDKDEKTYDSTGTLYYKEVWGNNVQDKVVAIELTVFNYNKVNINPSDLLDEFARNTSGNTNGNTVYYNFTDSYVAGEYKAFTQVTYFKANDFVNTINNVLSRRREIADRMLKTFYMTEEGVSKNFEITSNTDEMPVQPIIVYHEEEVDDESEYILNNTNLTYEQTNMLQNVNIPTITYKSSPSFGADASSDDIMITKSNNIEKKPLSTGIMNVKQKSIPLDSGNKDFPSISLSSGVKAIKPSKTNIVDLFEFPVIDKIESSSVKGWSKMINIPSYDKTGMINMDGFICGRHNNGTVERDGNFEIRKFGKYDITLSDNLNQNVNPYTYVERRVITGLTDESLAKWCIEKLRDILYTEDVSEEILYNIWSLLGENVQKDYEPGYSPITFIKLNNSLNVEWPTPLALSEIENFTVPEEDSEEVSEKGNIKEFCKNEDDKYKYDKDIYNDYINNNNNIKIYYAIKSKQDTITTEEYGELKKYNVFNSYSKETLSEIIDSMSVSTHNNDVYIMCDETLNVRTKKWQINQENWNNCIAKSLVNFSDKFQIIYNDNYPRQYAFGSNSKNNNLNIGEINETFSFNKRLWLDEEQSLTAASFGGWNEEANGLVFNQGENSNGYYVLYSLQSHTPYDANGGSWPSGNYDDNYPLNDVDFNSIRSQFGNNIPDIFKWEGDFVKIRADKQNVDYPFNELHTAKTFMSEWKRVIPEENQTKYSCSTTGRFKARHFGDHITNKGSTFDRVYCVYVEKNIRLISPLYHIVSLYTTPILGKLIYLDLDASDNKIIKTGTIFGIGVDRFPYFRNYDYTVNGIGFRVRARSAELYYREVTKDFDLGKNNCKIFYKENEGYYYYTYNEGEEPEVFKNGTSQIRIDTNYYGELIAKDITGLRQVVRNGREIFYRTETYISIKWVIPENNIYPDFKFISEQKDEETDEFTLIKEITKPYHLDSDGMTKTTLQIPKNNGLYDVKQWKCTYYDKDEGEIVEDERISTSMLIRTRFDKPCILTAIIE